MMKRLLPFLLLFISITASADYSFFQRTSRAAGSEEEKEWVMVDYPFLNYSTDFSGPLSALCIQHINFNPNFSGVSTGLYEIIKNVSPPVKCFYIRDNGSLSSSAILPHCRHGVRWSVDRPDGCYEEKAKNFCTVLKGQIATTIWGDQLVTGGKIGWTCKLGCEVEFQDKGGVCTDAGCSTGVGGGKDKNDGYYTGANCFTTEDPKPNPDPDPEKPDPEKPGGEGEGEGTGEGEGSGEGEGGTGGTGGTKPGEGGEGEGEEEGEKSSWAGSCAGGFTGKGDALAVAIAKAEWRRNCAMFDDSEKSDEYKVYEKAKNSGNESGSALKGLEVGLPINVKDALSDKNLLGGGSCPRDKSFNFYGHAIVMPFSQMCDFFIWLGYGLQATAFLVGLRIAFGGGKGD